MKYLYVVSSLVLMAFVTTALTTWILVCRAMRYVGGSLCLAILLVLLPLILRRPLPRVSLAPISGLWSLGVINWRYRN